MTPAEKVLEAERQVRAMLAREQDPVFNCPFCKLETEFGQFLCCDPAAEVINAVIDHMEHLGRCEVIERTFDRMADLNAAPASALVMN